MNLSNFFLVLLAFSAFTISRSDDSDEKCNQQNAKFLKSVKVSNFIKEFKFLKEKKKSVLLSWSHGDKKTIILVSNPPTDSQKIKSDVYISKNAGETFELISKSFDNGNIHVKRGFGLQRNSHNPEHVIIVGVEGTKHVLWISEDGGDNWKKYSVPFIFRDYIKFHEKEPWGLTISTTGMLYGTKNGGKNWFPISKSIVKFIWSSHEQDAVGTIYAMQKTASLGILSTLLNIGIKKDLLKIDGMNGKPRIIRGDIWQFSAHGKFLYVSEKLKVNTLKRYMKVSTDGGKTFEEVQLMSITPDRFYSIMDMSEGLIFMHVDNPGDTGHGTLYTSGGSGILYSVSLKKHLYPNFPAFSDFYRVLSMRGTYITTQMNDDNSMHTVISFNRGAEWHRLRKPLNAECKPGVSSSLCRLQISSLFSKMNHVAANLPLSSASAPGIILVHGHTHKSLQTTTPDVYVTSDGGYNWNRALTGSHKYQIGDHGGLLVAVPENNNTIVKFSTDEGRCWHSYQYTTDNIIVTGLLTEPNNKIMKIIIWGYGKLDHIWRVYSIDFSKAIPRKCTSSDYEDWLPHAEMSHVNGNKWNGCLLGMKETFKRLKKDSWCSNGQAYEVKKDQKSCPCTEDDYECEYGFSRPVNSYKCKKNNLIKDLDSCIEGDLKKIMSEGYRKLPGDKCKKGFVPDKSHQVSLHKKCGNNDKGYEVEKGEHEPTKINHGGGRGSAAIGSGTSASASKHTISKIVRFDKSKIVWIVAGVCLVLIAGVLIAVMVSRYRQLRERHVNYKYSLLNTQNDEAFDTALDVGLLDEQQNQKKPPKPSNSEGKANPVLRSYHDDSDVDMLE